MNPCELTTPAMRCPFCGSQDIDYLEVEAGYQLACGGCHAQGPERQTDMEALIAWNQQRQVETIEEREALIRDLASALAASVVIFEASGMTAKSERLLIRQAQRLAPGNDELVREVAK
jgi:Lar family restriction alleviation protein